MNVEYCAEQFSNDGSVAATLLKNLKRAMAGEYSRELSAKVFAGQCKVVLQGFRNGSTPGYALRRCLVDERGNRKMELAAGEWKSIVTDRIILVPGSPGEVDTVRRVYFLFIDEKQRPQQIADLLNAEEVPSVNGQPWNYYMIRELLVNEKYVGNSVKDAFIMLVINGPFPEACCMRTGREKRVYPDEQAGLPESAKILYD